MKRAINKPRQAAHLQSWYTGATSYNVLVPPGLKEGLSLSNLPSLDGLRAVAVALVVVYHFGFDFVPGGMGVLGFFVLSGFLITWLLLKEQERWGDVSLKLFYIRRTLRIFPAFYAYSLLLLTVLLALDKRIVWPQTIAALLYVNNYYQAIMGDPNTGFSHTWSLGIEEQFYLLWPMLFVSLRHNRRRLVQVLAGLIGGIWLYRIILVQILDVPQSYIYEAFDTRADHLLIGCFLAVVLRENRFANFWNVVCGRAYLPLLTLAGLVASAGISYADSTMRYRDMIGFIVDPLLVALLIVQAIALRGTYSVRWLNWTWVSYLGRMSYSIYLYQQIAIDPAKKLLGGYPVPIQFAGAVTTVLLASYTSYHVIEKPFLRIKDRFATRRPKTMVRAVA